MKFLVCLFLLLIPSANFAYKKMELPYSIVISKADLIVDGRISKVSKDKYEFVINEFVKGKSNRKIDVVIWKEWLCDPRNKDLKVGQRLMLFLEKTPYGNFIAINDSTGELYIDNNSFLNIFLPKEFSTPTVLKKGVSMFLETYTCYGDLNDRFLQNVYFQSNKSVFEIYKLRNDNQVFSYLTDYTMNSCKFEETSANLTIKLLKNYSTNSKTANSAG